MEYFIIAYVRSLLAVKAGKESYWAMPTNLYRLKDGVVSLADGDGFTCVAYASKHTLESALPFIKECNGGDSGETVTVSVHSYEMDATRTWNEQVQLRSSRLVTA